MRVAQEVVPKLGAKAGMPALRVGGVATYDRPTEHLAGQLDVIDLALPLRAKAGRYGEAGAWKKMTHETPTRPAGLYGASKIWGEAIARHYADAYGLSAICVRIGRVKAEDRPMSTRDYAVWCSQRDVVRMLELCIAAPPTLRFDVFFVVSDNRWGYRDLEHARTVLGFEPGDRAEDHRR